MMSCREATEKTTDYLSGRLGFMQRVSYCLHMFICEDCRRFSAQFKTTVKSLSGVRKSEPEKSVNDNVLLMLKTLNEQKQNNDRET